MPDYIGFRVARWRAINGMSQQQLGDAVGHSQAYISQIENGHKAVTKRTLLYNLASALGVNIADLTGQPGQPQTRDQMTIYATVPAVRTALDEDPTGAPRPLAQLKAMTSDAMAARMACDYARLRTLLPALLTDLRAILEREAQRPHATVEARRLLLRVAITAALTIKPFGHVDLAARLGEKAMDTAQAIGEAPGVAAATFAVAQTALAGGARNKSHRLAALGAEMFPAPADDEALTWLGMLQLHAALSAASLGNHAEAATRLEEARAAAYLSRSDPWLMEWSVPNVDLWAIGVALENGTPERAPELARRIDPGGLRTVQRRARLHIDTGRGHYAAGAADKAVASFLAADDIAPDEVRSRSTVAEIVGQMVRDARSGTGTGALAALAQRIGIDPLAPPDRPAFRTYE